MRVLELKNVHFWPFSEKRAKMEVFGLQHSHFSDFGHETKIWNSNLDHLEQLLLKAFCSPMKFFFQLSLYIVRNSFANSTAIFAQNQQKNFFGGFQPHMKRLITRQFDFKNFIGTQCAMSRWKVFKVVGLENRPKTCCRRLKSIIEKKKLHLTNILE